MPGKIKSSKQMRFLAGIAHGMKPRNKKKRITAPSPEVAREMIMSESSKTRKRLM